MAPLALFTVNMDGYTAYVDASSSISLIPIVSYDWDWGDGTYWSGVTATHTYATEGSYVITLTVVNSLGETDSATWNVDAVIIVNQNRVAMETVLSPYSIPLNPGPVHDHDSVYIYRILPLPVSVTLVFQTTGGMTDPSYVEVYDADNDRFLLPEKTEIYGSPSFVVEWDGRGVFEVRVWKDSYVTAIDFLYTLPDDQVIHEIAPALNLAPWVLAGGLSVGSVLATTSYYLGRKKK